MLWTIAKKEILENLTSPKFIFTFALCMVIILMSMYTGIQNYSADLREHEAAVALDLEDMQQQEYVFGVKIYKPPQVLSPIIIGIQQVLGRMGYASISGEPGLGMSKHGSNPILAIFGELDLTFIIKIVLSLFAILFTYDLIVGEKERGTLRLMLANNIPRDRIIFGKAIGNFISLLFPLLIPLLLSVIMLLISPDISLAGEEWMRILLLFLLFFTYLSVFFSLGLFVSTRTNRASSSLLILLFLWVVVVLVIPKAAVMMAGQIAPIPSAHEINTQKQAFSRQQYSGYMQAFNDWQKQNPRPKTTGMSREEQKRIRDDHSKRSRAFMEEWRAERDTRIEEYTATLNEDFDKKRNKQHLLATGLSRISPASALTFAAMNLGRTGIDEHENFLNSIKTYKPEFAKWANVYRQKMMTTPPDKREKPDLSTMPVHTYTPETLQASFMRALPDFIIMLMMVVVFFAGAFVSFLKYDVR